MSTPFYSRLSLGNSSREPWKQVYKIVGLHLEPLEFLFLVFLLFLEALSDSDAVSDAAAEFVFIYPASLEELSYWEDYYEYFIPALLQR